MLNLYVGGVRVQAAVVSGQTAAQVASTLALQVNAATDGTVTLSCKWTGDSGNDISLQFNRLGKSNGEETPAGLTIAALAALGDEPFEFICQPWSDVASLNAWQAAMDDSVGRWSWSKQLFGHVYTAKRGTVGTLVAAGQTRNDQHVTIHPGDGAGRTATGLGSGRRTGCTHFGVHLG